MGTSNCDWGLVSLLISWDRVGQGECRLPSSNIDSHILSLVTPTEQSKPR